MYEMNQNTLKLKLAMFGSGAWAIEIKKMLEREESHTAVYFIDDNPSHQGKFLEGMKIVNLFDARRLYKEGEIDAVLMAIDHRMIDPDTLKMLKFYGMSRIGIIMNYRMDSKNIETLNNKIYWLDSEKEYIGYVETHIVDECNLNCKGCGHFSNLFKGKSHCKLDAFTRDMRELSQAVDLITLRLLGGEPLLEENLNEYIDIARRYFPQTDIHVCTNGILIPQLSEELYRSMHRNHIMIDITCYPIINEVMKERIVQKLKSYEIDYCFSAPVDSFSFSFLPSPKDYHVVHEKCTSRTCHFLHEGKLYKCPIDALLFKYKECFPDVMIDFPDSLSIDIYSGNFCALLGLLEWPIELCGYCAREGKTFPWEVSIEPHSEDWIQR